MKRFVEIPLFPLLLAVFPAISLLGHNIEEVYLGAANRALLAAVAITLVAWTAARLVAGSWQRAAMITAWLLCLLFSYGYFYRMINPSVSAAGVGFAHSSLLTLWGMLFLMGSAAILLKAKDLSQPTRVLNLVSAALLVIPLFQIGSYYYRSFQAGRAYSDSDIAALSITAPQTRPDVWVIILDAHLRADVLQETFQYDSRPFVDRLTEMGFYVARCSMSNYRYTPLSLASSLNMDYLDRLGANFVPPNTDRTGLFELIRHNALRANLESLGYQTVSIVSYQPLGWDDADVFVPTDPASVAAITGSTSLTQFERMLAGNTVLAAHLDADSRVSRDSAIPVNYPYADDVHQQFYILDQLKYVVSMRGPKVVFVHINLPHPPYVFNADGSLLPDPPPLPWVTPLVWEEYMKLYPAQVAFIDREILPILNQIIDQSETPPVIVVQGDHGADSANKLAILNAYHVPASVMEKLYPSITPVNSFRVILDGIFGTSFGLLQDRSYLSTQGSPYQFEPYRETMPNCQTTQ